MMHFTFEFLYSDAKDYYKLSAHVSDTQVISGRTQVLHRHYFQVGRVLAIHLHIMCNSSLPPLFLIGTRVVQAALISI